jgi:hypothetical protein
VFSRSGETLGYLEPDTTEPLGCRYAKVSADKPQTPDLSQLSDEELLRLRLCDLPIRIEASELEGRIHRLYREIEAKELSYRPKVYLGDEWFSPEGMNAIAVPFYLAHPRLMALEKSMMMEVEGGEAEWCMRLLRHEAGHCFDHTYHFSKRAKWRRIFGSPSVDYHPETYRPQPYSRSFVKNLDHWYAQSHPDEDFAETFAVWLNPARDWKKEYGNWASAFEKLGYVELLAKETARLKPLDEKGRLPCSAARLTTTLEKYYKKRKREHAESYPDFYDSDLRRIFNGAGDLNKREYSALKFMNKHRKSILGTVAWATSEKKFTVDGLVKRLAQRCDQLELRVGKGEIETVIEVTGLLTSLVKNYLFTGKFKRKV